MTRFRVGIAVVVATAAALLCSPVFAEGADLRLVVERDEGSRGALRLGYENHGDRDVILYVDSRAATIELRDGRRVVGRCRAPRDALEQTPDERRFVTLAPGQRAVERLDLRFLCFGRTLSTRLEEATSLRVRYRGRFATDRFGRAAYRGTLGPVEVPLGATAERDSGDDQHDAPSPVRLTRVGGALDVSSGDALTVTLELRGPPRGRLRIAVRPELFSFHVEDPLGRFVECQLPPSRVVPLREFYERLQRRRVSFELATMCPARTFSEVGVYDVTPIFRAIHDGHDVGLDAWTGRVEARSFLARVRRAGRGATNLVQIERPDETEHGGGGDGR